MFKRLAVILMLVLLHLQWGLAQAHDSAEEIHGLVLAAAAPAGDLPQTQQAENQAHSQETGGVCQFHDLAHSVALAALGERWGVANSLPSLESWGDTRSPLASGVPALIDRPRWPHHAPAVVAL